MKTISSLQGLRALAALSVVAVHVSFEAGGYLGAKQFYEIGEVGEIGVDIFFAISGFIMYTMTSSRRITSKDFIIDRLTRVWPAYAICTIVMLCLAIVGRSIAFPSLADIIKSMLFVPYYEHSGSFAQF